MLISFGNVVFATGTNAEPTLERLVLILVAALVIEGSSMDTALYVERMSSSMTPEWVLFFLRTEHRLHFLFHSTQLLGWRTQHAERRCTRECWLDDPCGATVKRETKGPTLISSWANPKVGFLKIVEITHAHTNARNMNFRLSFKQVINSNSNMFQQQLNGPNVFWKYE